MKRAIIIVLIIGVAILLITSLNKKDDVSVQGNPEVSSDRVGEPARFEGTISAYSTDCFFDAVCSVTVDGKTVVLVTGGRAMAGETAGQLLGVESISDLENKIGATAEVYAAKVSDTEYTVYGNAEYYVLVK